VRLPRIADCAFGLVGECASETSGAAPQPPSERGPVVRRLSLSVQNGPAAGNYQVGVRKNTTLPFTPIGTMNLYARKVAQSGTRRSWPG